MKKEPVSRFSVSLPPKLLEIRPQMSSQKGYDNRSLAIGDLMRAQLVEDINQEKSGNEEIAGTITLVYDHHTLHTPQEALTDIQHHHHKRSLSRRFTCTSTTTTAWRSSWVARQSRPDQRKSPTSS